MVDLRRWVLLTLVVACVVGLIIWARGTDHHRGQDVGAVPAAYAVSSTWGS